MRRLLIAGIACLTLALAPLEPVHASKAEPQPAALALAAPIGIVFDPARGDRRPQAAAILPRHGVGGIDRNRAGSRPERRMRRVNTRRGRYDTAGRSALRRSAQIVAARPPARSAFAAGSPSPRPQERTVVQR